MPQLLTLFEYETRAFAWNDAHLAALERLNRTAGDTILQATVKDGKCVLRAGSWVGVVRFGNTTIQILPKMHRSGEPDKGKQAAEATRNLLHLLAYALDVPIREQAIAPLLRNRDSDWFEILTRLFATHLRDEWQRGAVRRYETCDDELPMLRGKWRITEQIRRPERRHVFAVAFDEFTPDNSLNQVFRFVVERLWHTTRDGDNRRVLGELRCLLEDVTLRPVVSSSQADATILTRLNRRWEPLLNLARLFLDGGAFQPALGGTSSFAFAFDMNRLFESFVVGFLRRHRSEILPPELADCEMLPQTRGAERWLARDEQGRNIFKLKPDLAFRVRGLSADGSGDSFPLLLDMKYKPLDPAAARLGVSQSDLYQMFAYAHRYDCPRIVLLYPQTAATPKPVLRRFSVSDTPARSITAATIDLRGDLASPTVRRELITHLQHIITGLFS